MEIRRVKKLGCDLRLHNFKTNTIFSKTALLCRYLRVCLAVEGQLLHLHMHSVQFPS